VAHFVISALLGRPITIYGDGRQVRDTLYVDDLLDAFDAAVERANAISGDVFNIGGGPRNTLSLLELIETLSRLAGRSIELRFGDWRPGDQRVYVSDIRKAGRLLGWEPQVAPTDGVARLWAWAEQHLDLFAEADAPCSTPA
jgi:CDP-paratose 2-epimerase